jgi:aryl-alcohol dehydrogenase-like predicted oxidoreductase
MAEIALGTVQFGLKYGVANTGERVSPDEVRSILDAARTCGVDTLDTAIAYGDAEANLGAAGTDGFQIVTKLAPLPGEIEDVRSWVISSIHGSLERLNRKSVDAVLLHRSQEVIGQHWKAYQAALEEIKMLGLCSATGVSIYAPDELETIWEHPSGWKPELIQAPYNVLDRRLSASGWLDRLNDCGIRVHTRSAFLQGLLLMPSEKRPAYFADFSTLLDRWQDWCRAAGKSRLSAALGFVCAEPRIEKVVLGVDSASQLVEIAAAIGASGPEVPADLVSDDLALIDPSRWRLS